MLERYGIKKSCVTLNAGSKRNSYLDNYPNYSSNMGTGGKDNGYSYSNGDYSSNSMSWRRKLNEDSESYVTEKKMVISRATSPQPDSSKQVSDSNVSLAYYQYLC